MFPVSTLEHILVFFFLRPDSEDYSYLGFADLREETLFKNEGDTRT